MLLTARMMSAAGAGAIGASIFNGAVVDIA
jgi:hypothetical protein